MACSICNRETCPRPIPDTGGTCDVGSLEYLNTMENAFYSQAKRCCRLQVGITMFNMARVKGLHSSPAVIANLSAYWYQPIVVAHVSCHQSCVFVGGRAQCPICLSCALLMASQRRILLLLVRDLQVFIVHHGKRRAKLRKRVSKLECQYSQLVMR